jgi:hypothetical protein
MEFAASSLGFASASLHVVTHMFLRILAVTGRGTDAFALVFNGRIKRVAFTQKRVCPLGVPVNVAALALLPASFHLGRGGAQMRGRLLFDSALIR